MSTLAVDPPPPKRTASMSDRAVDPPPRRLTRSMSKRAVDPPPQKATISMSKRAVDPSPQKTTASMSNGAVDPPPRRITRSMSLPKRKFRPMPRLPLSTSKARAALLKKQFKQVDDYVKQKQTEPRRPPIEIDLSDVRIFHITFAKHSAQSRIEAGDKFGVIWGAGGPKRRRKSRQEIAEDAWRETVADVMYVVIKTIKIHQKDVFTLSLACRTIHNNLLRGFGPWRFLDFDGLKNVGEHLVQALSMQRYRNAVEDLTLQYAQDFEDKHLELLRTECEDSLGYLVSLNLNGCENISDRGVKDITSTCPRLKHFSICGNLRVADFSIKSLAKNCKFLTELNLSGCKNITDKGLLTIGNKYHMLESLDITKCEKVTDVGVIAVAVGCSRLKFLSLYGIPGVTDRCLETLSEFCSATLTTLDVNCCTGIESRRQEELLQLFPNLRCFST